MFKFLNIFNKKKNDSTTTNNFEKKSYIARCPKCNSLLAENNDYLYCADTLSGTCDFKIDRNINGKKISLEMFADFQNIPNVTNVYNIVNSERDRVIKYYEDIEKERLESYIKKDTFFKEARRIEGTCPTHSSYNMYRKDNIVKCGKCDFELNTVFCGVNFSDDEISNMLTEASSEEHQFIDENGESINTVAFLDFDEKGNFNGKFKLVTDLLKLEEHHLSAVRIYPKNVKSGVKWIRIEEYLKNKKNNS